MRDEERLILLSWPRTGSSSLWRILQAHSELSLFEDEPFNEHFTEWSPGNPDYLGRVHDMASLDVVLAELFEQHRGIKLLSYQLDPARLRHLILRPDLRVIYLSRDNLLQIAVSDRIAKQTQIWNRWDVDPAESLEDRYGALSPLDLDDLRTYVRDLRSHLTWLDALLALRTDGHLLRLRFEDLYLSTPNVQEAHLAAIWKFLDLPPLSATDAAPFLDPSQSMLGGPSTYGRLPNLDEINAVLGSDGDGWLPPNR